MLALQHSHTSILDQFADRISQSAQTPPKFDYQSDRCYRYLISIKLTDITNAYNLSMILDESYSFPSCDFWNVSATFWDTAGCFVHNISNDTITCGCIHLTTFRISKDEIVPEANILTEIDWKRLTFNNLITYPTVWITYLILLIIFIIICLINPRSEKKSKSIIAYEDIIYRSVQEQRLWDDIAGKEIKYITEHMPNTHRLGQGIKMVASTNEAKKALCHLQFRIFIQYLRNDHTLWSVFQRSAGTNFTLCRRLACFFMYLLCSDLMIF